jgi:antitoxin ParD1/3/4
MSTTTMNISLPDTLKRFVQKRTKDANYSNPSDYVRALIREDQRREAAEKLLHELVAKHGAASTADIATLEAKFWQSWNSLKSEIDKGMASLARDGGQPFDGKALDAIKRNGRERLSRAKPA